GFGDIFDAMGRKDRHTEFVTTRDQRRENRFSAVADRKQFPRFFPLQRDAQRFEPFHRRGFVERRENVSNDISRAVEILQGDSIVRDVAPPAARDQDFGTDGSSAVENDDAQWRARFVPRLGGEDGGGQAGGAGADDRDVI